jgi:site-specific DNA recombinase
MWRRWNFLVLVCCCGPLLLAAQEDSAKDYRIVMAESEKPLNHLEVKLTASITDTFHVGPLCDKAIITISQLDVLYEKGTVVQKRKIISSMFPEKMTFDGFQYRTPRVL